MNVSAVDGTARVVFKLIDSHTTNIVTDLHVSTLQKTYVAPNKRSLEDAKGNPGSWCRMICADEIPVGFTLLFLPFWPGAIQRPQIAMNQICLWRLMIDHRYQGMGFGHQSLTLIRKECLSHAGVTEIISSYVPGPYGPEKFYLSEGFEKTGRTRANGAEIEISLFLL
jgi:diamine N-acetyltransferase